MATYQHTKAPRVKILNAFPGNNFGNDGDIVSANIRGKGVYLCIKNNGRWFVADKLNDISRLDKPKMENLKVDSLAIRNAKLDTSKQDGDFTLDVHGKIELNTDGGSIEIKDGSDSHFTFDCDNTRVVISDDEDSGDRFVIQVAQHGATTISTSDDDATAGHLTMQPDGDLVLDPVSQKTIINATDGLYFDGGTHTNISESSDDTLRFIVGGTNLVDMTEAATNSVNINNSELTIDAAKKLYFDSSTLGHTYITESSADVLDVYVGGDKMLALDEANDKVSIGATNWVAGTVSGGTITEFSAANSAYAGMILGYTRLQGDLSSQGSFEIQNALTVEDDTHKITFTTPPSEEVEIEATFFINFVSTSTTINCGLSTANATDGYASVAAQFEYDAHGHPLSDGEADDGVYTIKWILSAGQLASVGSSNTFWIGFGTAGSTKTAYLMYGVRATHGICDHPFVIKATALPAAIYDGQ